MEYNDENTNLTDKEWHDMAMEYQNIVKNSEFDFDKIFSSLCELCDALYNHISRSSAFSDFKSFLQTLQPQTNLEFKRRFFAKPKDEINFSIFNLLKSVVFTSDKSRVESSEKIKKLVGLLLDIGIELNSSKNKKW